MREDRSDTLTIACNWMAARPWTVGLLLAVAIVLAGLIEVPA